MDDAVAQVRSVYETINRGDYAQIAELVSPGFEWHPNAGEPDPAVRHVGDALDRVRDFVAAFDDFRTEIEEVVELGSQVAVAVRHRGIPAGAMDEVERREVHLWTFADGRPVALHEYASLDVALAAADDAPRDV